MVSSRMFILAGIHFLGINLSISALFDFLLPADIKLILNTTEVGSRLPVSKIKIKI